MNIYIYLNLIGDYIDNNIDTTITLNDLAKETGLNKTTIQSIFPLTTGYGIKEYIRLRRLTLSVKDIQNNISITDTAIKYCYTSPTAFSRAFKKFHGIKPSEIKNKPNYPFKLIPKINYKIIPIQNNEIKYEIINNFYLNIYGIKKTYNNESFKSQIDNDWKIFKGNYNTENQTFIGMFDNSNKDITYYFAKEKKEEKLTKYNVKGTYLKFTITAKKGIDIQKEIQKIHNDYIPSLYLTILPDKEIEIYNNNNVELYFPIKES